LSDGDTSDGGNGDRPQAGRRNRRHHGFARPCSLTRTSDTPGPSDVTNPNLDWALMELDPGIWRTEPLLEPSCVLAGYHPPDPKKLRRVSIMMPFRGLRPGYIRPARTSIRNWGGRGQSSRLWTVTLLEELRGKCLLAMPTYLVNLLERTGSNVLGCCLQMSEKACPVLW
jgi:hypothetical protein